MRACTALIFLLSMATLSSSEPSASAAELGIRFHPPAGEVELGKAFPLIVERTWPVGMIPGKWNNRILAPLVVRLNGSSRRVNGSSVEETLRFRCYAFSLVKISIPAPLFTARPAEGGPEVTVNGNALDLPVKTLLDPALPGAAELPGGLLEERTAPADWVPGAAAGALALALLLLGLRYRARLAAEREAASAPTPPPHETAQRRLSGLREKMPISEDQVEAFHIESAELVRDYMGDSFDIPALRRTTEELLDSPRTATLLRDSLCSELAEFLLACDRVKFGGGMPVPADCEQLLERAGRIVAGVQADLLSTGESAE